MKKEKLVLTQKPNLPIITWAVATVASKIFNGKTAAMIELIAFGALFTWAWLEIFQGANNFRRALGLVVITFAIYNRLK